MAMVILMKSIPMVPDHSVSGILTDHLFMILVMSLSKPSQWKKKITSTQPTMKMTDLMHDLMIKDQNLRQLKLQQLMESTMLLSVLSASVES